MINFDQAQALVHTSTGMNEAETASFLTLLMSGELAEQDGAQLLIQLAERGETGAEVAAFVKGLRAQAVSCPFDQPCFDVCGTGGSGLSRFNISTTVSFICAAAGIPVAKHGNRGSRRPNGSFDLLDALGIPFELTPQQLQQLMAETNLVFFFARLMHPAVGKVVPYRKAAGRRTIFNLAGPLANPTELSHQIIGCTNEHTAGVLAEALQLSEIKRACVVWGAPGIDEFSVTGQSNYFIISNNSRERKSIEAALHPDLNHDALPGGDAEENAEIFHNLLSGTEKGPLRDMLILNAGAAIDIWNDRDIDPVGAGVQQVTALIDSGAAYAHFEKHRDAAKKIAGK